MPDAEAFPLYVEDSGYILTRLGKVLHGIWETIAEREEVEDEEVVEESEQQQEEMKVSLKMQKRPIRQELGTLGKTYRSANTTRSGIGSDLGDYRLRSME